MCMQVHDNANKISTIPRQCHPPAIIQMVMDGLRRPLGNATRSECSLRVCVEIHTCRLNLESTQCCGIQSGQSDGIRTDSEGKVSV